jgi:hypothetical protein
MRYTARVVFITVHEWDNEHGQGEHVCNKGGYRIGKFSTLQAALAEVREQFDDYVVISEDGLIQTSLIENAYADTDPNGEYIANYDIIIERVERVDAEELEAA